jgi:predicted secreted protein
MKSKLIFAIITFITFAICNSSCKKADNNTNRQVVQFDGSENGKTIAAAQGQTLMLTLGNPGDGGYAFDAPQYNPMVLSLTKHTHIAPTSNALGDSGKDTWEFKALNNGNSTLRITATRSFDKNNPVVMFSGTIAVN